MKFNKLKILIFALTVLLQFSIINTQRSNQEYYKKLNIPPQSDVIACKKQCKRLLAQYQDVKTGINRDFQQRQNYLQTKEYCQILSQPDKKQIYDQYGEEGLKQIEIQGQRQQQHQGLGMFHSHQHPQRTENKAADVPLSLEELYNGASVSFTVQRKVLCNRCHGTGDKEGKLTRCSQCKGRGHVLKNVNMGGFQMQMQENCPKCRGKGRSGNNDCPVCRGRKIHEENTKVQVEIKPGMKDKQKIVKKGMSDENPEYEAGDLLFFIQQKEHSTFQRLEDDLYYFNNLKLKDAILGYSKNILLLNRNYLTIKGSPGSVIQPNSQQLYEGYGMPKENVRRNQKQHGDLLIQQNVQLPKQINSKQKEILKQIFAQN